MAYGRDLAPAALHRIGRDVDSAARGRGHDLRDVTADGQAGPGRAQGRAEGGRELPREGGARRVRPGEGHGRADDRDCEWRGVSRVGQAAGRVRAPHGAGLLRACFTPSRGRPSRRRRRGASSTRRAWFRLGREGPVLEREAVLAPAALHRIARLRVLRQSDDTLAVGAAHPVGDRGDPAVPFGPHPEGQARSVRAIDHVAGLRARRHGNLLAAVRASHGVGRHRSRRRLSLPRSKPTITSSPTTITGTARRPVLATSSARAASSSATFFAVNATP